MVGRHDELRRAIQAKAQADGSDVVIIVLWYQLRDTLGRDEKPSRLRYRIATCCCKRPEMESDSQLEEGGVGGRIKEDA
jgi:hypothetical protein